MKNKLFSSKVVSGHGTGKKLGFPTLNLQHPKEFNYQPGVYAGWVIINQKKFIGAFHYGPSPTFNRPSPSLEVFVIDQFLSSTPKSIDFQLVKYLRSTKSFTSQSALAAQISQDVSQVKQLLSPPG